MSVKAFSKNNPDFWKTKFEGLQNENLELKYRLDVLKKELQLVKKREFVRNAYSERASASSQVMRESPNKCAIDVNVIPSINNVNTQFEVVGSVNDKVGGEVGMNVNLDVIVQRSLDKFGEKIASMLQGVASNFQLLVKTVTRITERQEAGPTTRGRPAKVSTKRSSDKKLADISETREVKSAAAGSKGFAILAMAGNRTAVRKKKRVGIIPNSDNVKEKVESETGGNFSPSIVDNSGSA